MCQMIEDLVIDDERTMPAAVIARTRDDGLRLIRSGHRIRRLWLDHDLGGDDTIMPVVDHLAEMAANGRPGPVEMVIVHSANPVGASNVTRTLTRWGYRVRRWPATAADHPLRA